MKKLLIFLFIFTTGLSYSNAGFDVVNSGDPGQVNIISGSYDKLQVNYNSEFYFGSFAGLPIDCNSIIIERKFSILTGQEENIATCDRTMADNEYIISSFPYGIYDVNESLNASQFIKSNNPLPPGPTPEPGNSIAENINLLVSGNITTQISSLLSGNTGLLIGGLLGLIVLTLVIGYVKGWFGNRKSN